MRRVSVGGGGGNSGLEWGVRAQDGREGHPCVSGGKRMVMRELAQQNKDHRSWDCWKRELQVKESQN